MKSFANVVRIEQERFSSAVPARQAVKIPAIDMIGESFRNILNGRFELPSFFHSKNPLKGMMHRAGPFKSVCIEGRRTFVTVRYSQRHYSSQRFRRLTYTRSYVMLDGRYGRRALLLLTERRRNPPSEVTPRSQAATDGGLIRILFDKLPNA